MELTHPSIEFRSGKLTGIDRQEIDAEFSGFQSMFFNEFGIIIPPITRHEDPSLPDNTFQLVINGQAQPAVESLEDGEFWLYLPASQLQSQSYFNRRWDARPSIEPNSGGEACIVRGSEADRQLWSGSGSETRSRQGFVVFSVAAQIRKQPAEFFTPQLLTYYLTRLVDSYPDLVAASRALLDMDELYERLESHLQSGSSIQNLPARLEEMLSEKI